MVGIGEVLEGLARQDAAGLRLGLTDLDDLTGGLRAGEVWLITGPPRHGRTLLAVQMAAAAAASGRDTRVLMGVDSEAMYAGRVVATTLRVGLHHAVREWPPPGLRDPADADRVLDLPLELLARSDVSLETALDSAPSRSVVIVDDLDRWTGDPLDAAETVKAWALGSGGSAVLTLPRGWWDADSPAWQAWVRAVDVVLDITMGLDAEAGYAFVRVMHNRRGSMMLGSFHGAYVHSRLEDLDQDPIEGAVPMKIPPSHHIDGGDGPGWD